MKDLLAELNDKQKEAVTAGLGPVLVLAGAGSGKTRALTYRIAWLLAEKKFAPENILALTFTNKAAGEMRNRIIGLIGGQKPDVRFSDFPITAGTFHSVCAKILRHEIHNLGQGYDPNFTVYDSDDSLHLLKQIVLELGLTDQIRPQVFGYYISAAKNRLIGPESLEVQNEFVRQSLSQVARRYQAALREHNALDFDDLLALVCQLFRQNKFILKKYQERFQYVLVDEYQDTNHAQYTLLKMLCARSKNLFVVGDDAQSIYGFRGANMQNILNFKKDYPRAKVVLLEQNYRSTAHILSAANEVIKLNPFQYEKKLWTRSDGGAKVNLYEARDENDEAEFVLSRIIGKPDQSDVVEGFSPPGGGLKASVTYTPILDNFIRSVRRPILRFSDSSDLSETVILYRTHAQSRPFEEALLAYGVPYQIIGGFKFYERREIKDTLAYLKLLGNPRDLVSLARVINIPPRGIGPVTFKTIVAELKKCDYDFSRMAKAEDFFGTLAAASALPEKKNILELMKLLLVRSGYKEFLLSDREEGLERWANIEELWNAAAKYRQLPWSSGAAAFLEEVALMTDLDRSDDTANRLTLMTLHSAKGLEFDTVFFVGLEEGLLPHSRSMLRPEEIAEEVRLAYVGITRARKDLYLSHARMRQTYGELKRSMPSRILKAIPKKLINKIE